MGGEENEFSGNKINYAWPIREMIFDLRQSIRNDNRPYQTYEVLDDFKTLTLFTLNNIKKWNYSLICNCLGIPYFQSKSKIFKEIAKKWERNRDTFDFVTNPIGLEYIYACSVFEFEEEDFLFVDKIIMRFHAVYLSFSLERLIRSGSEGERQRFGHDLRIKLRDNYQFKFYKNAVIHVAKKLLNGPYVGPKCT